MTATAKGKPNSQADINLLLSNVIVHSTPLSLILLSQRPCPAVSWDSLMSTIVVDKQSKQDKNL